MRWRLWCIISLARLGQLAGEAEEMHDRGIVPDDAYAVLKAVCQCNSGDAAPRPGQAPCAG